MPSDFHRQTATVPLASPFAGVRLAIAALLLLFASRPGQAADDDAQAYTLDPVHTRVMFAIEHAGFSQALGTVSGSTGVLLFDPDDWTSARLDVRVPLTRLDLGDAKWNAATLAGNLLNAGEHPEARFISTGVQPVDAAHARVCGELTLRGVTRPLCLEVTLNAVKRYPLPPFRRTAGFSATASLSRSEFGIDAWRSVIGDRVELRIEAEAVRADRSAAEDLPTGPTLPEAPAVPAPDMPLDDMPVDDMPEAIPCPPDPIDPPCAP